VPIILLVILLPKVFIRSGRKQRGRVRARPQCALTNVRAMRSRAGDQSAANAPIGVSAR
jgi:hypothetical protein